MNNRKAIILLLLGIIALVAANTALQFRGIVSTRIGRRTELLKVPDSSIAAVTVERAGLPAVRLENSAGWRLTAPFSASVDEPAVLRLLDSVAYARVQDEISDSELLRLGHERANFGLAQPACRLTVTGADFKTTVCFGARTPAGDGVYVTLAGADSVLVVSAGVLDEVMRPVDSFRRRSLFTSSLGSVTAFDVRAGGRPALGFVRGEEGWKVGGDSASTVRVRAFLEAVAAAEAMDFIWPVGAANEAESVSSSLLATYGLDPESALTVTFRCADGVDRQLSFGKEADSARVYALVQQGGAIVTVASELRDAVRGDAARFTDARVFPFAVSEVGSFTLAAAGVSYALARDAKGEWHLEAPVSAPAEAATVEAVLSRILALGPGDLGVGEVAVSLSSNAAPVMVAAERLLGRSRFEDLRSCEILRLEPEQVKRLVRTVNGRDSERTAVAYSRERRAWNVESSDQSGTVRDEGVAKVLEALNPLRALRIEKLKVSAAELAGYGLEQPYLTLAVDLDREDAVRRNLLVGERVRGGRYATVGSADAVFVLDETTVKRLQAALINE